MGTTQDCYELSWKQHPTKRHLYGHLPSISKIIQVDELDMRDTAGEARMNSLVMFFYGPLHMEVPVLADQQELIYI